MKLFVTKYIQFITLRDIRTLLIYIYIYIYMDTLNSDTHSPFVCRTIEFGKDKFFYLVVLQE